MLKSKKLDNKIYNLLKVVNKILWETNIQIYKKNISLTKSY